MKWLWKTVRQLFFLLRLALWLLALAAVCAYAWLHYVGVPLAVRDRLVTELARNGVAASVDRIRLELPFSLAARHVAFGDVREPDRPLMRASRVTLSFDLSNLWRGEVPRVNSLWLEGGELSVPVDFEDPKSERIEAHNLTGRVRLKEDNVIAVEQIAANLLGLRVSLQGQLGLPKPGAKPKPPLTREERAHRAKMLHNIKAELGAVKCEQPPLVTAPLTPTSTILARPTRRRGSRRARWSIRGGGWRASARGCTMRNRRYAPAKLNSRLAKAHGSSRMAATISSKPPPGHPCAARRIHG